MNSLDIVTTENEQFKEHYNRILKKVELKKLMEYEPTKDEITKVFDIIIDFIKSNKRKVYGGYALNKLLISKNPSLAIYDEIDIPDIEFYSPDPMKDLIKLCDTLHEKGFKNIIGQEAQHKGTYSIFVNFQLYCDISYMSTNIYNKCRFVQLDGFNLIHPWFITIDFFRMFTDPIISYWRLEKHFVRYLKLQKSFPLPTINKPLIIEPYKTENIRKSINLLEDFLAQKTTTIFTGFYVYNYYLTNSNFNKSDGRFKQVHIPYLEVYSTEYIKDGLDVIKFINELPEELSKNISYNEFYPFFVFYGYNTVFYYNDNDEKIPILYLYSNNNKCIPFKQVSYIPSDNKFKKTKNDLINIGSFDFNILHALIILVKVRVDDDNDWNDIIYTLINGLVSFRKSYFKKNKKTLYDDTIYEGFVIDCKGETMAPDREKRLLMQIRKKLGKPAYYRYESGVSKHPTHYNFPNSSGNMIKNKSNFKLIDENLNSKIDDELENEEKINEEDDNEEIKNNFVDKINISESDNSESSI